VNIELRQTYVFLMAIGKQWGLSFQPSVLIIFACTIVLFALWTNKRFY